MIEYIDRIRNDLMLNMLVVISSVLIMLLLILKVETSPPSVEIKNIAIVTMEWPGISDYDLDLWIKTPNGTYVGFDNKEGDGVVLQRDDTGLMVDKIVDGDGKITGYTELNLEILNIRHLVPGRYYVNVMVYSTKFGMAYDLNSGAQKVPVTVKSQLIQITPFAQYEGREFLLSKDCQEKTLLSFDVDNELNIVFNEEETNIRMGMPCTGSEGP